MVLLVWVGISMLEEETKGLFMSVQKLFTSIFLVFVVSVVLAKMPFVERGLFRMQSTLLNQMDVNEKLLSVLWYGDMEFYLKKYFSLRADMSFFKHKQPDIGSFVENHFVTAGVNFHHAIGNIDPFFGFHSGVSLSKFHYQLSDVSSESAYMLNPVYCFMSGINVFVGKTLHLFGLLRYSFVENISGITGVNNFNDLSLTMGLGWNFKFGL